MRLETQEQRRRETPASEAAAAVEGELVVQLDGVLELEQELRPLVVVFFIEVPPMLRCEAPLVSS